MLEESGVDILEKMETDEDHAWVSKMCMDLLRAKEKNKITQEQLDYELCKLSMEFINDYRKKWSPTKPIGLLKYESLSVEDFKKMKKEDYEKEKYKYTRDKRIFDEECERINSVNGSNLLWLKKMKSLAKSDSNKQKIDTIIHTHQES